ncbi:MAG TPA: 2Fe-2S iron-sulfur cluster binding domain-containing protein [Planctomycetaceae bacterium]|nr:2Fe-2S iron-sulfur cluster binding domain-containing protein [Planctomycetaceae bacterium]
MEATTCLSLALSLWFVAATAADAAAQISPEEHAKHHPGQAAAGGSEAGAGEAGSTGGQKGQRGDGKGGMMGGGMGGMMEKMGAPKAKELYPRLMELADVPMEERAKIQEDAHQRMVDGTELLSEGLEKLAEASPSDDFAAMQAATALLREGLARFESGLAAHRAIAEGKAPRNVALKWFKREMNLLPPAGAEPGFRLWGMSAFHTAVMAILVAFAGAMIWMYFFKMRRASELLQRLATAPDATGALGGEPGKARMPQKPAAPAWPVPAKESKPGAEKTRQPAPGETLECCVDSVVECASDTAGADRPDISQGLLRAQKRKLCRMRVARIFQETPDVKTFRLVACHGGPLPFSYLPDQFLTLTLPVGQKPIRRSYTISSSPTQGYYCEITVKREEHGLGSRYLHDVVNEGDMLQAQAPSGKFVFTGSEADSVVLIAGGVGITPMMSITRALTDMGWDGEIRLIVACRHPEHFIFREELEGLDRRHPNLHLHVAMSRAQSEVPGYHRGRLSKELLARWVSDIASKRIHLCGAPPMMEATIAMLAELGVAADQIHTEDFGSQRKPQARAAQREAAGELAKTPTAATVSFQPSDKSTQLLPDETILEAAERVGVEIENSCRVGMCGVCAVKLLSGQVTMETDDGLDPDDRAAGKILACQARADADVAVQA